MAGPAAAIRGARADEQPGPDHPAEPEHREVPLLQPVLEGLCGGRGSPGRGGGSLVHGVRVALGSFMGNLQSDAAVPLPPKRTTYRPTSVTSITPSGDCEATFV
ncbi:hypothetical protein SMICM304S_02769 [Streptomyces microflavus]